MTNKLVYSSDGGRQKDTSAKSDSYKKSAGPTKMRLETNGRGGKAVTVLFNLPFEEKESQNLLKELQGLLGCGGTFKNSTIEIRGDMRDRIEAFFTKKAWKIVRAGG